jgi:hypothetical protein
MEKSKVIDLIVLVIIVILGLVTAYVCFGILNSSAEAEIQKYSVGGALAGALVTMSLSASVYLQFRKLSTQDDMKILLDQNAELQEMLTRRDELKILRDQNTELQQKLLRGAPCPEGFVSEVAERAKLVIARPGEWTPGQGVVFNFECSIDEEESEDMLDIFPPQFIVSYWPSDRIGMSRDELYETMVQLVQNNPNYESDISEIINIGGPPVGIKSLKTVTKEYVEVEITKEEVTGKYIYNWIPLPIEDYYNEHVFPQLLESLEEDESSNGNGDYGEVLKQLIAEAGGEADLGQLPEGDLEELMEEKAGEDEDEEYVESEGMLPAPESDEDVEMAQELVDADVRYSDYQDDGGSLTRRTLIWHMKVWCYAESLNKVFTFDFYDDEQDYTKTSETFNKILDSVRFLE